MVCAVSWGGYAIAEHQQAVSLGEKKARTAEVMPRTRASALNSSVVGVDAPVQTAIRVLASDKREPG